MESTLDCIFLTILRGELGTGATKISWVDEIVKLHEKIVEPERA